MLFSTVHQLQGSFFKLITRILIIGVIQYWNQRKALQLIKA